MDILAQSTYLIIDDSNIIQSATRAILIKLGVPTNNIVSTTNAREALAACRDRQFDILLIDHDLGSGSTGLQLLEYLRHKTLIKEQALVFIVTGNDSQDIFYGYSQFEPDGYLIKPICADDIISRVSAGLVRRRFCQSLAQAFNRSGLADVKPLFASAPNSTALKEGIIFIASKQIKKEQYDDAIPMLSGLLKHHNYLPAQIKLIEIMAAKKQFKPALDRINELMETNKNNIRLLNLKANICISAEMEAEAEKAMRSALALNASNIEHSLNLAWLFLSHDNISHAKPLLLQLASLLTHSMWDNSGRRALSVWGELYDLPQDELMSWRAETAWTRLSNEKQGVITSKGAIKAIRTLHLLRLEYPDKAKKILSSIIDSEITNVETGYLICRAYLELGLLDKFTQLSESIIEELALKDTSLSQLQSFAIRKLNIPK